ncbi:hypothetical protein H6F94_06805 [Leptolyngbya sp. FACHB-261]|nr:hypothetical protein [Leptolyngbya sp. FACHB-261]
MGLVWVVANAVAGAVVGALEGGGLQFFATLVLTGFVLGTAQWLVLQLLLPRLLRPAIWWIVATGLGWFVGITLSIMVNGVLDPLIDRLTALGGSGVFWLNVLTRPIPTALLGVGQWLILRRHLQPSGEWILASALGGAVQGGVGATVCAVACQPLARAAGSNLADELATAVAYGSGWAGYGLVTGLFLVWLWRNHRFIGS